MKLTNLRTLFMFVLVGCGGGEAGLDLATRDPRCVAACPETMPRYDGIGAVCDAASRALCLDECEARIADLPSVCQSCLVEEAEFRPDGDAQAPGGFCDQTTCTLTSEFGMCSFPVNDEAASLACRRTVDPRREVSCEAEFRPTTECARVCN